MNTNDVIIIKELMKIESRLQKLNTEYQAGVSHLLEYVREEICKRKELVK